MLCSLIHRILKSLNLYCHSCCNSLERKQQQQRNSALLRNVLAHEEYCLPFLFLLLQSQIVFRPKYLSLPYSAIPTNPQITKFNVASKTTADGKLSVDIEVKSGE